MLVPEGLGARVGCRAVLRGSSTFERPCRVGVDMPWWHMGNVLQQGCMTCSSPVSRCQVGSVTAMHVHRHSRHYSYLLVWLSVLRYNPNTIGDVCGPIASLWLQTRLTPLVQSVMIAILVVSVRSSEPCWSCSTRWTALMPSVRSRWVSDDSAAAVKASKLPFWTQNAVGKESSGLMGVSVQDGCGCRAQL